MLTNTSAYLRHPASRSIGFIFSIGSLLLGIWVAALPALKQRLELTDGTLGLSLLLAPAGSLTAVMLSSRIFSRVRVGKALLTGSILQCLVYIAQVAAVNRVMFWSALFAAGFLGCLTGIASNAVVDSTEKKSGMKIMSTSHGMYSLGGFVSAGLAAILHSLGIADYLQIMIVAAGIIAVLLSIRKQVLQHREFIHAGSAFAAPPGSIIGLAFICFVSFMGEGCIADWSAIYLSESLHSSPALASAGFAGFSIAMCIGRLNGDGLIHRLQPKQIVMGGAMTAAAGFFLVVAFPLQGVAIAGFTLVGLGFSCIVPILFSAAANVKGLSPAMGIASIASGGLIGFMVGPAMIGFISEKITLAWGLSFVLLLSLLAVWAAYKNKYLSGRLPSIIQS
jgi:predicted MFS family arabinose efflux permease